MLNVSRPSQILKYAIHQDWNELDRIVSSDNVDWEYMLRRASANRMLYIVAKHLAGYVENRGEQIDGLNQPLLTPIIKGGEEILDHQAQAVQILKDVCEQGGVPYRIVKTGRPFPFITNDVDLLIRPEDYQKVLSLFEGWGAEVKPFKPKLQMDIYLPNLRTRLDLHSGFFWQGIANIGFELVWENPVAQEIFGVPCVVANPTAEWILVFLNLIGERMHVPWLDFLFLKRQIETANSDVILSQARQYGWVGSLVTLLSILDNLNESLYGEKLWFQQRFATVNFPKVSMPKTAGLPYLFSLRFTAKVFLERFQRQAKVSLYDMAYYGYAKLRYHWSREARVPVWGDWFNFEHRVWRYDK